MSRRHIITLVCIAIIFALSISMLAVTRIGGRDGMSLGLDLEGGTHLVYEADFSEVEVGTEDDAVEVVREIIEKRINRYGVSEPNIQIIGSGTDSRISVQIPGVTEEEALSLVGAVAELDFRELKGGDAYLAIDFMAGGGWKAEPSIEEPDRSEGTRILSPVVPLIPAHEGKLPFGSWKEMMGFAREGKLDAWEVAVAYESAYGKIGPEEVLDRMRKIARVMRRSVEEGLELKHWL